MWKDAETNIDYLNFNYLVDVIEGLVTDRMITPSTIGVYGDWGSGKSSLMRMVQERITNCPEKKVVTIHFNGWLFEGYEDAKTALCGTILETISKEQTLGSNIRTRARKLLKKVDFQKILGQGLHYGIDLAMTGGLGALSEFTLSALLDGLKSKVSEATDEDYKKLLGKFKSETSKRTEIKEFQSKFAKLIEDSKVDHLVVFIDELDRCAPDTILDIFSAMRLFLFAKGTSFVIGADERLIQYAIKTKYRTVLGNNLDIGKEYLEKLIQYPVNIPRLSETEIEQYLFFLLLEKEIGKGITQVDFDHVLETVHTIKPSEQFGLEFLNKSCPELFDAIKDSLDLACQISRSLASLALINGNPRQCKRFLNTLDMRLTMAHARQVNLKQNVMAKLMLLEYYKPELFLMVVDPTNKTSLMELEELDGNDAISEENRFKDYQDDSWFQSWLKIPFALSEENLQDYYYFARKDSPVNWSFKSRLTQQGGMCYDCLTSGSDTRRMQGLKMLEDLSPNEKDVIFNQLFEEMTDDEEIDSDILKSFVGFVVKVDSLAERALDMLLSVPVDKYTVPSVGILSKLKTSFKEVGFGHLLSYLETKSSLKTALKTLCKFE